MNKTKRPIPGPPAKDGGILKYEIYLERINNLNKYHQTTINIAREKKVSYGGISFVYGDKIYFKNKIWFVGNINPKLLQINLIPKECVENGILFPYSKNSETIRLPELAMFYDIKKLKKEPIGTDEITNKK